MAEDQQERTEEATQQRREDFRKRGQVAQTRELASVFVLLGKHFISGNIVMILNFFLVKI
jgi:flagellar biosynthetic protein FlhB